MSLFLTADEVAELTGYKRPYDQRRWLGARGWPHELDANCRPKVSRAYAERRLAGEAPTASAEQEPDFSAVK